MWPQVWVWRIWGNFDKSLTKPIFPEKWHFSPLNTFPALCVLGWKRPLFICCLFTHTDVTGIFFWGGKVIFPEFFPGMKCFFPLENSHFGRPKTYFRRFQKWKAKRKKKRSSPLFRPFLLPFTIFHVPFYNFPSFLPNFHSFSLFSLPLFSRYISKNFLVKSLWGDTLPPACYATDPHTSSNSQVQAFFSQTSTPTFSFKKQQQQNS